MMKKRCVVCAIAVAGLWMNSGCGPSAREETEAAARKLEEAGREMAEASKKLEKSLKEGGEGLSEALENFQKAAGIDHSVEPVAFRKLKEALPAELDGFTAGKATGEQSKVMGIASSMARVRLAGGETGTLEVRITDNGSVAGWAALAGKAAGAFSEYDRETESGFERSMVVDGVQVTESYDESARTGAIRRLHGGRFTIEVRGDDVSWEQIQAALDAIDLARLNELAEATVESAQAEQP